MITDSEAALELALQQIDDPEIRSLGWTISKILGDDIEHTTEGGCKIGKRTAPDSFISLSFTNEYPFGPLLILFRVIS